MPGPLRRSSRTCGPNHPSAVGEGEELTAFQHHWKLPPVWCPAAEWMSYHLWRLAEAAQKEATTDWPDFNILRPSYFQSDRLAEALVEAYERRQRAAIRRNVGRYLHDLRRTDANGAKAFARRLRQRRVRVTLRAIRRLWCDPRRTPELLGHPSSGRCAVP